MDDWPEFTPLTPEDEAWVGRRDSYRLGYRDGSRRALSAFVLVAVLAFSAGVVVCMALGGRF